MSDKHGVYIDEEPTSIFTMASVDSAIPVVVGTAPVHTLEKGKNLPIHEPKLISTLEEYIDQFGSVPEGESEHDYTLSEFASVYIGLYKVCPVVFINVFDPSIHTKPIQGEDGMLTAPDVSKVTARDIIGGIDGKTMQHKGLELVDAVFPLFTVLPGQILAPGFSSNPEVALSISTKTEQINGHFSCTGIIDIASEVQNYTEVPAWLKDNNLCEKSILAFFGTPTTGNKPMWGSSHLAGGIGRRDADNDGIPFWSPSNSRLLANGLLHNGRPLTLDTKNSGWLNARGVVTGINFVGGLKFWGNYTTAYPAITDVKDVFIPVRRMFSYVGNTLVLSTWQKLDSPIVKTRHIESIVESVNRWLTGLVSAEKLLGGKVSFNASKNPDTDIMNGIVRYNVSLTPPSPAQEITYILSYDHTALSNLFGIETKTRS